MKSSETAAWEDILVGHWADWRVNFLRMAIIFMACLMCLGDEVIGVEASYNDSVNGSNGREYGYFDSELNLERTVKAAKNGNNIIMTIDSNVQKIVEDKMAAWQKEIGSENMAVILMNPQNGEIYAMASNDGFDLNSPRDLDAFFTEEEIDAFSEDERMEALNNVWKNYCLSATFEPGSTFKPFTIGAALDEAVVKDSSTYLCDGSEFVGGHTIRCVNRNGHGKLTLSGTLEYSCNDALMQIGALLGKNSFYQYNQTFGFGNKTGIDLPGEEVGILHTLENMGSTELATSSFGQTQNVTMIQMMAGFCSLINGGNYYKPHIVKEILNEQGAVVQSLDAIATKQTVSRKTSSLLSTYMSATLENGTACGAKVSGYGIT